MPRVTKKFTVLINDETVIKKLEELPVRSKGHYISEAIKEKMNREQGLVWDEKKLKEMISLEVKKIFKSKGMS
ncbi:hypothetical protein [Pseudobacteroides cellulosolvens]|uniref:Uncharacterized protein n=1 Tax=Pseudobacteroides cellulosolvens ATCC 35603 = DSM 2933 TaxID=398512 RepID=A0A0L6JGC6_9FIRM|nr:hypothetical protein [Pseudobacteroides cellulosolvens]KNY24773.1 hypothetical protein Bccel_0030 [Pseudobacteroides cellulosolvens ATCC 35603 = DSM 2933]